jgi:hypothetical protein
MSTPPLTSLNPLPDLEAHCRLTSVLEIVDHEGVALARLNDPRLEGTVHAIGRLRAEIVVAIATLAPLASEN